MSDESIVYHPACKVFPLVEGDDYTKIKSDIAANGLREKIEFVTDPEKPGVRVVIEGRTRHRALKDLKEFDPKKHMREVHPDNIIQYVISKNLRRRHMTTSQRNAAAADLEEMLEKEAEKTRSERASMGGKARAAAAAAVKNGTPPAPKGKRIQDDSTTSRGKAAKIMNAKPRTVQDAKFVKEHDPKLHEQVKAGKVTVNQAKKKIVKAIKEKELKAEAKKSEKLKDEFDKTVIIHTGDVMEHIRNIEADSIDLIVTDPKYNQGLDYGQGKKADLMDDGAYGDWCREWVEQCYRVLAPNGTMLLVAPKTYGEMFAYLGGDVGFNRRSWITWYETFGQNNANGFNNTSRFIFYWTKNAKKFTFNAEAVTRVSRRQELGDKRANPDGKLWDDVWIIPRLVGTAKERIESVPTQLSLGLVQPMIDFASKPGDTVLDPFVGSGTTVEAAIRGMHGMRKAIGIDLNAKYTATALDRAKVAFGDVANAK